MYRWLFAAHRTPQIISDSLIEALWETLVAVAIAAAIGIAVVNLAAHLDKARAARMAVAGIEQADSLAPPAFASDYEALRFN